VPCHITSALSAGRFCIVCGNRDLYLAGSVPDAADLVVTDPVQAGVMAVMAVADTAKFNVARLKQRVF
jgi:uncharacterized protein with ACT and thioredoxin-like domain